MTAQQKRGRYFKSKHIRFDTSSAIAGVGSAMLCSYVEMAKLSGTGRPGGQVPSEQPDRIQKQIQIHLRILVYLVVYDSA